MAKVDLVEKVYDPKKWEPFATLTLSKRELAGLHKLLGASHYRLVGGGLYTEINKLISDLGAPLLNYVDVKISDKEMDLLDSKYGEV